MRIPTYGLIATLGLAAFAFGSVEPWAEAWLGVAALALFAGVMWSGGRGAVPAPCLKLLLPAIAFLLVGLVQIVPLPDTVLGWLGGAAPELHRRTVPPDGPETLAPWLADRATDHGVTVDRDSSLQWPPASAYLGVGRTLSIDPGATGRAVRSWAIAILFVVVSAVIAADPVRRYRLLWGVSGLGAILGAVAVLQQVRWNDLVLWIRERPIGSRPLGPFVNPNHFAGFVEMCLLVAVGLGLALIANAGGKVDLSGLREALADRAWTAPRLVTIATLSGAAIAGLLLSGSRGGVLATLAGVVVLAIGHRFRAIVVLLAVGAVVVALSAGLVAWVGDDTVSLDQVPFKMSSTDPSGALRLDAWAGTLRILGDYPVFGSGLGSFRWAYASHRREGEWMNWSQAHNDYLQIVIETGVVGALVLLWGAFVLVRRVILPALDRSAPRWTSTATVAAVAAMLVHSVVDFNLQIPSNSALFAVLVGVVCAAAADRREPEVGA